MALKTIEHKAEKGRTLTLDEVAAFVDDARRSGATGTEVVSVTASWRGKIQGLAADVQATVGSAESGSIAVDPGAESRTADVQPWTPAQKDHWNQTGIPPR